MKTLVGILLFCIGMVILFSLGSWQFLRGLEKANIDRKLQAGRTVIQLDRTPDSWASLDYQRVSLVGTWLTDRAFLQENRIYQGAPGYEVLVPFQLSEDGTVILVNRGWIPVGSADDDNVGMLTGQLPDGVMYRPEAGFTLGETMTGPEQWPQTILYLDMPALSQRLGLPLASSILVLGRDHADAFQQLWQPTSVPASRHYGYAVQWWGLGLTLLIFGVIWWRRPNKTLHT